MKNTEIWSWIGIILGFILGLVVILVSIWFVFWLLSKVIRVIAEMAFGPEMNEFWNTKDKNSEILEKMSNNIKALTDEVKSLNDTITDEMSSASRRSENAIEGIQELNAKMREIKEINENINSGVGDIKNDVYDNKDEVAHIIQNLENILIELRNKD